MKKSTCYRNHETSTWCPTDMLLVVLLFIYHDKLLETYVFSKSSGSIKGFLRTFTNRVGSIANQEALFVEPRHACFFFCFEEQDRFLEVIILIMCVVKIVGFTVQQTNDWNLVAELIFDMEALNC